MLVTDGLADVLLYPSAFTVPTGLAHWHLCLRSRAVERQVFVVAAAQVGAHNEKRRSYGHALAVGPWGDVLADAGGYGAGIGDTAEEKEREDEEAAKFKNTVVFCEIDLEKKFVCRQNMPLDSHRKEGVPLNFEGGV